MGDIDLDEEHIDMLIGFHLFTGNDYCSSFFRKGMEKCFKTIIWRAKFQAAFDRLGVTWELTEDLISDLKQYLCSLYRLKWKEVNKAHYKQSKKKCSQEKVTGTAALIPWQTVFINYIACIWSRALLLDINEPFTSYGWNACGNIIWVDHVYLDDIKEIIFQNGYEESAVYGMEGDSEGDSKEEF